MKRKKKKSKSSSSKVPGGAGKKSTSGSIFSRISKMQGVPIVGVFSPVIGSALCSGTGTGYCSSGAECNCC